MRELTPERFEFGKYDGGCIPTSVYLNDAHFLSWMKEQVIVGYLDSSKVPFRPREGYYAVMFEFEHNEYWSHVPDHIMGQIL